MNTRFKKTLIILTLSGLLVSAGAFAQKGPGPGGYDGDWLRGHKPTVEERLARISEALDLTPEQSVQMLQVLQEQEQQRLALHEETMALMGEKICAQRETHELAVLDILTAEQAELFLEHQAQRHERARARGRSLNGPDCSD